MKTEILKPEKVLSHSGLLTYPYRQNRHRKLKCDTPLKLVSDFFLLCYDCRSELSAEYLSILRNEWTIDLGKHKNTFSFSVFNFELEVQNWVQYFLLFQQKWQNTYVEFRHGPEIKAKVKEKMCLPDWLVELGPAHRRAAGVGGRMRGRVQREVGGRMRGR